MPITQLDGEPLGRMVEDPSLSSALPGMHIQVTKAHKWDRRRGLESVEIRRREPAGLLNSAADASLLAMGIHVLPVMVGLMSAPEFSRGEGTTNKGTAELEHAVAAAF